MTPHNQIGQLAVYFVTLLPLFVGLAAPGILLASLFARRWRVVVKWKPWEYAFIVPLVLIWFSLFAGAPGKTWYNLALEPLLIGLTAVPYVCIRRYCSRGWQGYFIAMAVCSLAVVLMTRTIPTIPCAE
jgi:hypothetical protein